MPENYIKPFALIWVLVSTCTEASARSYSVHLWCRGCAVESCRLWTHATPANHDFFFFFCTVNFKVLTNRIYLIEATGLKLGQLLSTQPGCMWHSLAGQLLRLCRSSDAQWAAGISRKSNRRWVSAPLFLAKQQPAGCLRLFYFTTRRNKLFKWYWVCYRTHRS